MAQEDYTLIYWPTIPGRGEFIRLALEYTSTPYKDQTDPKVVTQHMGPKFNPAQQGLNGAPALAPPMLIDHKNKLFISQTPNILSYLGPKLGLAGDSPDDAFAVAALALTFLDLSNETHDTHHPIAAGLYYEDQKDEAIRRAEDFRSNRVPKFLAYAQRCIDQSDSIWVYGKTLTYADLVLFQIIEGLIFAFPKLMKTLQSDGKYYSVFKLRDNIAEEGSIKAYFNSGRRESFGNGLFRHYPELDEQ